MGRHFLTLVALLCFFSGEVATGQTLDYGFAFYSRLTTDVRDVSTVPGVEDLSLVVDFDHPDNVSLECGDTLLGPPGGTVEVYGVATLENSEAGVVGALVSVGGEGAGVEFLDVADPGYSHISVPETDFLYDLTASSDLVGQPVFFHGAAVSIRGCANVDFRDGLNGVVTAFALGRILQEGEDAEDAIETALGRVRLQTLPAGISRLLLFKFRVTIPVNGDIEAVEISFRDGVIPCPRNIGDRISNAVSADRGQGVETEFPTLAPPCTFTVEAIEGLFLRGDGNGDGTVDITDPVSDLGFLFLGTFEPLCLDACDFNDDGIVDVSDPISNLRHQFIGGPPPALPGKFSCGVDPTDDVLGCEGFGTCPADA